MIRLTQSLPADLADAAFLASPTRQILVGDVVTMNWARDVVRQGRVCIDGATIAAVLRPGDALPSGFEEVTPVDTAGTIFPGLIDLHNHLTYNMLPMWPVPKRYTNRNQWRTEEPSYQSDIAKPASLLTRNPDRDYARAIVRYAECRNLFGGVTTGQGMSLSSSDGFRTLFQGLMRNVEQPLEAGWAVAGGQTLDYLPEEIASKLVPALATGAPFFYHLSEGTDSMARQRFLDLRLANGGWAVAGSLICIHCVGLQADDFDVLKGAAGMVWSPTSNLLLYGKTADVAAAKARGIPIALGADWSPSGCKNLLGELKVARAVSEESGALFSSLELVEMATLVPARMIGWQDHVGAVSKGRRADLLVIEGSHADPYTALIDAKETAIRAILIDGRVRLGEAGEFTVGEPATSELFAIGGKHYFIDLVEPNDDAMGGMSLATAVAKLGYGLQHLPDMASKLPLQLQQFALPAAPAWHIDLELESEQAAMAFAMEALDVPAVRPMALEPITAVDDPLFAQRLRDNPNLPDYVKRSIEGVAAAANITGIDRNM